MKDETQSNGTNGIDGDRINEQAMVAYGTGQAAFERGQYREAINCFQTALQLVPDRSSPLGGAIQIWLVTAYDAAGQRNEALNLCRQLHAHSDYDTRQQSRRLIYILEAPKLQSRTEWLTQIPDLAQPQTSPRTVSVGQPSPSTKPPDPKPITAEPFEPINPKESLGFMGLALGVSLMILLALWWLSQATR
jgi:tetratricopeptide (TPR) repeat protein